MGEGKEKNIEKRMMKRRRKTRKEVKERRKEGVTEDSNRKKIKIKENKIGTPDKQAIH